jgi:cytochrome P450
VFYPHVKQLLLEIGARCFLGIEDMRDEGQLINALFLDLNAGMVTLLRVDLPFIGYGRALRARQRLEAWFASQVERRRADPAGAGGGDDVLSHLCRETDEAGQPYGQQMIVNHAIFLLFAAHDTTASALTHLAMYIGRDADLQQRLREELASLTEPLTREALAPSGLAERCFHEAMRLHPPVPMMVRRTISAVELAGVAVPAHTLLFMPTVMNHIDPRWWQEPARFDPERFAPARAEQRSHPLCYHPFGSGAHKCIGLFFADMVVKTVLQRLLTRYTLQTPAGYAPRLEWVPLPKPADGVPLRLTRL